MWVSQGYPVPVLQWGGAGASRGQVHSKESAPKGEPSAQARPGEAACSHPPAADTGEAGTAGVCSVRPPGDGKPAQLPSRCVALIRASDRRPQRRCHPPRREAAATAEPDLDASLGWWRPDHLPSPGGARTQPDHLPSLTRSTRARPPNCLGQREPQGTGRGHPGLQGGQAATTGRNRGSPGPQPHPSSTWNARLFLLPASKVWTAAKGYRTFPGHAWVQ